MASSHVGIQASRVSNKVVRSARVKCPRVPVVVGFVRLCNIRRKCDYNPGSKLFWPCTPTTIASLVRGLTRKMTLAPATVASDYTVIGTSLTPLVFAISSVHCLMSPSATGHAVTGELTTNRSRVNQLLARLTNLLHRCRLVEAPPPARSTQPVSVLLTASRPL